MKLTDFQYNLPEELIAQYPLAQREKARLLIVDRKNKKILHDYFSNVYKYLPKNSVVVLNNTKVIPARLLGRRSLTGGQIEVFLLKQLEDAQCFEVLIKPLKRLKQNDRIAFQEGLVAELINREKPTVRFNVKNVYKYLDKIGHMPLPPYIKRSDEVIDKELYQTVYAKHLGSVAAPTAGLHFTKELLAKLRKYKIATEQVTLHVNYGTFRPVEVENIKEHQMHSESYEVRSQVYQRLINTKKKAQTIVAVGTTSARVLETVAVRKNLKGTTNIFIYPGFDFKMVDILITNFHLPFSTLLMLVYAFGGKELMQRAYQEAIKAKYRFFSYGDAMIIL